MLRAWAVAALLLPASQTGPAADPSLVEAIARFYAVQEEEDVDAYLALWSETVQVPRRDQLIYVFENGDDRFSSLRVTRTVRDGDQVRARVEVQRERTIRPPVDGLPPAVQRSVMRVSLVFVKEGGAWKLVREGPAADDLALELAAAGNHAERDRLIDAEPDLLGPQLISALGRLGSAAAARQAYPQAVGIFQQVALLARRAGLPKEEGEALQNAGSALYFMRRYAEARSAYEARLTIERNRGDRAGIAAAVSGIATIGYSLGEYAEALTGYQEAFDIHLALDDVAGIAYTALSIGHIAYLRGDFAAAAAAYERSLHASRTMTYADGESRALEGLGRVAIARGDYVSAIAAFERVRRDGRMRNSPDRLGAVAQSLGDVHVRLGNLSTARRTYDESRGHFESVGDLSNVGRVLQALGLTALLAGQYAEAEAFYRDSAARCTAAEDRPCSTRAVAALAYAQAAQQKFWDAVIGYRKAVVDFTELDRREDAARAEVGLSQALSGAGDQGSAIEAAWRARDAANALGVDDVLWRALGAEARAIRRIGDVARARRPAVEAAAVIARMASAALDRPDASVPADAADALALLARLEADAGEPAAAFATAERMRALMLRSRIAPAEREIARGMTDEDRELEREHAADVLTALARLERERELPRPDLSRLEMLQARVNQATAARRAWARDLFARLPELQVWRGLVPERTAADARPVLAGRDVLLLSFVVDEDGVLVCMVSPRGDGVDVQAAVMPIPRRMLAQKIWALQQPALLADAERWERMAAEFADWLPPDVTRQLARATRVLIIPHDILWRMPFAALPVAGEPLVERAAIVLAASLDGFQSAGIIQGQLPDGLLVAVGAPHVSRERLELLTDVAPDWPLRSAEDARHELDEIVRAFGTTSTTVLTADGATEARLRSRAGEAAFLHIAAPFRLQPSSPLFSPLLLTGDVAYPGAVGTEPAAGSTGGLQPRETGDDGVLELREIFNATWRARVVAVSDGGALAMRDAAAAVDVLHGAWRAAGVPSILMARWPALPRDADRLLRDFYQQARGGSSPAEALRAAQRAMRARPETAAPLHWAGWAVVGP